MNYIQNQAVKLENSARSILKLNNQVIQNPIQQQQPQQQPPQQSIQPSVQINIQSLIKPMDQEDKLVYSFATQNLGSKFLPAVNNRSKKITWGNYEYEEDDFADILGYY